MKSQSLMPLELLQSGEWAQIEEVSGEPTWVKRLAELGLCAGCQFRVVCQGSPCVLQIGETRLSLRGQEGTQILARPLPVAC